MAEFVYHWTHRGNLSSIVATGLDPAFSEGRLVACWVCDKRRVSWAQQHVAQRHGWDPDDLVLVRVRWAGLPCVRTHQPDVYTVRQVIEPGRFCGVRVDPVGDWMPHHQAVAYIDRDGR